MSESLLSSALDDLEQRIKSAKSVDIVFHPSVSDLRLRYLVENSKPTRTLDEMLSDNQTELRKNIQVDDNKEESTDVVSEEFKISFREVLRLAKSGQQSWWTEKLKESTNAHIECLDEYYRKNYDEKVD